MLGGGRKPSQHRALGSRPSAAQGSSNPASMRTQAGQPPQKTPKPPPPDLPKYSWRTPLTTHAPMRSFKYITSYEDAEYFLGQLDGDAIGFDAEWKPNYVKGETENPISLVQLADASTILLIHISVMGWRVPKTLKTILENPNIPKLGVGISGDTDKIKRDLGISMLGCVELSNLARFTDPTPWAEYPGKLISLAKLTEVYVRNVLDKPKKLQRGNWERLLPSNMQEYAANDAAAGLSIYLALKRVEKANEALSVSTLAGSYGEDMTDADSSSEITSALASVTMPSEGSLVPSRNNASSSTANSSSQAVKVALSLLDRLEAPRNPYIPSNSATKPKRRQRQRVITIEDDANGSSTSRPSVGGNSQRVWRPMGQARE